MSINKQNKIEPTMIVLDIVSAFQCTEEVFKRWDIRAGECICCNALFDSLEDIALKYDIELSDLLVDLNRAADKTVDAAFKP